LTDLKFKADKAGVSLSLSKKAIEIEAGSGNYALKLTNEYGNSLIYELTNAQYEALHAELWRFVKESQH
jgi:hypothetical protein